VVNGIDNANTTKIVNNQHEVITNKREWSKLCGIWQFPNKIAINADNRSIRYARSLIYHDGCKEIIQHMYGTKFEEDRKSFKATCQKFELNCLFQRSEVPPPEIPRPHPNNIIDLVDDVRHATIPVGPPRRPDQVVTGARRPVIRGVRRPVIRGVRRPVLRDPRGSGTHQAVSVGG